MEKYIQEVENLLTQGRSMSEDEFDKYLDSYFRNKSDFEKGKIGEATLKIKLSRWEQIKKINDEIQP